MKKVLLCSGLLFGGTAHAEIPRSGLAAELAHLRPNVAAATALTALEKSTLAKPPAPGRHAGVVRQLRIVAGGNTDALVEFVLKKSGAADTDRRRERVRQMLLVGALEALADVPEAHGIAVANAVLSSSENAPSVLGAAARVLGKRAQPIDVDYLCAMADAGIAGNEIDRLRGSAAIAGLGQARVTGAVHYLGERIRRPDTQLVEVAEAAAFSGSSWAWQALGPAKAEEGRVLRDELLGALVATWPRANAEGRVALARAMSVIDADGASSRLKELDNRVGAQDRLALKALREQLADSHAR